MISNHNHGAPQNYHNMQEPVVDSSKGNVAISQFSTQKWALSSQRPEFFKLHPEIIREINYDSVVNKKQNFG